MVTELQQAITEATGATAPQTMTTYCAQLKAVGIPGRKFETTDVELFIRTVRNLRTKFPNLPIYCFKIEEVQIEQGIS